MKFLFSITIIFLSFVNILHSQNDKIYEITGKVVSEKDNLPIHYATIINLKKGKATTCDSLGFFHITVLRNDILRVNALGFERYYINVKDSNFNNSEILLIKLVEKTYKIANVDIFDARWKDFEFEFIHTETEKQETKERIENWFYTLIDPKELALITASVSVGFKINYKTKADKQRIKVEELKIIDLENKIIESKYNPELVSEITGFNKSETIKFMRFCNFDRQYLIRSNDYDIIIAINNKLNNYYRK